MFYKDLFLCFQYHMVEHIRWFGVYVLASLRPADLLLIGCCWAQWAVCGVFVTIIALAVAELGSAAPTAGGLYYWTFKFSSPKWRCLLSWIVGCEDFPLMRLLMLWFWFCIPHRCKQCGQRRCSRVGRLGMRGTDYGCWKYCLWAEISADECPNIVRTYGFVNLDIKRLMHILNTQWSVLCIALNAWDSLQHEPCYYCTPPETLHYPQYPVHFRDFLFSICICSESYHTIGYA